MTRDRLHAYWRVTAVTVALAVTAVPVRLFVPEPGGSGWLLMAMWVALALVIGVAMIAYRPRPWSPEWAAPQRAHAWLTAITNGEPLPTSVQRVTALDHARRMAWLPVQQLNVWSVQAMLWSSFDWSPPWLRALCLVVLLAAGYVLWRLHRRITTIDQYDDTVPLTDVAA